MPLTVTQPQTDTVIFGFDSAWSDKNPGAICALALDESGTAAFHAPQAVCFAGALDYIAVHSRSYACAIVALDQPTIVPNQEGMRPAEKVAASLLSFTGGGVQPANRKKKTMFGDCAPIWKFKEKLDADDDAEKARFATKGTYLIEVFPALALPGLVGIFALRLGAPKYNPRNSKFRQVHWNDVVDEMAAVAQTLALPSVGAWLGTLPANRKPTKREQDCLDAVICVLIGFIWRACAPGASALIGDLGEGYIATPVSAATRKRMAKAAAEEGSSFRLEMSTGGTDSKNRQRHAYGCVAVASASSRSRSANAAISDDIASRSWHSRGIPSAP